MNNKKVWHVTLHEMRTLRRLLRTHVFVCVALIICTCYFFAVTITHMQDGSEIPMLSVISPRYIMSLLSGSFIALFCIGVLLLTFDQINRDEVTRIHEVMNSKPMNKFELLTGRLLGVSITMAIPMLFFLCSISIYGMIADVYSFKFGEPVELWSVVSFVLFDIAPNFLFFGSLVIVLSLLLKSRLTALLLTLGGLFTLFWFNSRLPLDVSRPLHTVSGNVIFPSDLIPTLLTPTTVFNRLAFLLMGIGFLWWSSCLVSRVNPNRSRDLILGGVSFTFGLLIIGSMFGLQSVQNNRINEWVEVHDEHFDPSSFPDVHEMRGRIDIKPGQSLTIDLTLDLSVDADHHSGFVLFSLNPGYHISRLEVDGEEVIDREFQHGLLKIPVRYFTSDRNELMITATGSPDKRFAYLDSLDRISQVVGPNVRQLRQLGTENSIFHSKFVLLPPGIKWYPTSGTATNEDAWELRKRDFFTLNIEVSVPRHWLVAGPAKRETLADGKRAKYRFHQSSPLPEFALIGSRFESASIEVEGVLFECLYAKTHRRKFERFTADPEDHIRQQLTWRLEDLRTRGFEYPYGSLTLVEVPSSLRVFGGGLEMDTVMSPPGLVMIREVTLPTTTVDLLGFEETREEIMEMFNLSEQDFTGFEISAIRAYLENLMFESNVNIGFYRSLHIQQTSATGDGARALNTLMDLLIRNVFWGADTKFDFNSSLNREILNLSSVDLLQRLGSIRQERRENASDEMLIKQHHFVNAPATWDAVGSFGWFDPLDRNDGSLKIRAMKFRTQRVEQLLRENFGRDNIASFLVELISQFRGKTFTFEEFDAVLGEHGVSLTELAGDLIESANLPGFSVSSPSSQVIEHDENTTYETTFLLQNGEPVSGPVKLSLNYLNEEEHFRGSPITSLLPTVLVEANQSLRIVIESSNPVSYVWIEPYLSLNRMDLRVDLPESEQLRELEYVPDDSPTIKSITAIDQVKNTSENSITIDDLDPGFSVVELGGKSTSNSVFTRFFRNLFGQEEVPMDHGLPKYSMFDHSTHKGWYRWTDPTAFGVYRRTLTFAERGDGLAFAKFTASLPEAGPWTLEYYLPKGHFHEVIEFGGGSRSSGRRRVLGTVQLEVQNGLTATNHTLDAANLTPGWQTIGTIDLSEKEVDVKVSNKTDELYMIVFADAIRWTPVEKGK